MLKGQVTIKFNNELLQSTEIIDSWFPLSARPNKKDSVSGQLQLRIQYGDLKTATAPSDNNINTVEDKDKNKHDNLKVSSRFGTQGKARSSSLLPLNNLSPLSYSY